MVPELNGSRDPLALRLAGVGFALWGIFAIAYGTASREAMERALREGRFHEAPPWPLRTLTLGRDRPRLLTALLILLD